MDEAKEKGHFKDLNNEEAVAKLKKLAEKINICLFCTELETLPITTRPMAVQQVDVQGNIWFISSGESNKNFEIKEDNRVQLFFAGSAYEYLSIYGNAYIYKDKEKIEELWTPIAKAWFEEGKDDPSITVIRVAPSDAYYWDTENGKLVSFFKIAAAALTGAKHDGGVEGALNV